MILLLLFIFILSPVGQASLEASSVFDLSGIAEGTFKVDHPLADKKLKVMVQRGATTYYYDLKDSYNVFPLQFGSGEYSLALLENLSGTKYTVKYSAKAHVELSGENTPFLQCAYPIFWNNKDKVAQLAQQLTGKLGTDEEKAVALYNYVITNISYDREKIHGLGSDYVPSVEDVLTSEKAICYDYAALYAAMLRSVDIPAKLVKGYKNDIDTYHAWNEVYLKDKGWVTADATYDAVLLEAGTSYEFAKDAGDYIKEKEY